MKDGRSAHSLAGPLFWALLPLWWPPLTWWLVYSPSPVVGVFGLMGLFIELFLFLLLPFAFLAIVVTPPALLFREHPAARRYSTEVPPSYSSRRYWSGCATSASSSGGTRSSGLSEGASRSCKPSMPMGRSMADHRQR